MGEKCSDSFRLRIRLTHNSRDLLHAANLRHGTDGFTSPPKEGVLRIFSPLKISFDYLNNIMIIFSGVHPFVAHHVNTGVRSAVSYNKVLLLSLTYATGFGRVDHPQA